MPLNYEKLMSTTFEPTRQTYARRDTMLYALGVGVGALDPFDPQELKYVYEKNLVALPTFAVTLAAGAMRLADPVYGINYRMLLHAEQTLEMHKPLPVDGTVVSLEIGCEIKTQVPAPITLAKASDHMMV